MTEQDAPLVQNINLGPDPQRPEPKEEVKTEKQWKDQTELGLQLTEPFTANDVQAATGTTIGGAQSQIRRWIYWGWVKNVSYGKYVRTPTFGGVKGNVGYNPTRRKPYHRPGQKSGKVQIHCDVPGCNYIAHGIDERNAKGSIGRHKSKDHGFKRGYIPVAERARLGYSPGTKAALIPPTNGTPEVPAPEPEIQPLNYCPGCGLNLQVHQLSYRVAVKHRRE